MNPEDLSDSDEYESSEEEFGGILKKFLDVKLPDDFDPKSVPQTGEEYLHHVIYERTKKCKPVVSADIDISKYKKNQTFVYPKCSGLPKALDKFYPTKEWQDQAYQDFLQFRNFLANSCFNDYPLNYVDYLKPIKNPCPPTFSELTSYSQACKILTLHAINTNLNFDQEKGISEGLGAWIYGILALLEKPLTPDCYAKIRGFAKNCGRIRATLSADVNEKIAMPLNLYICIIARYFEQQDLLN